MQTADINREGGGKALLFSAVSAFEFETFFYPYSRPTKR